MKKLAMVFAALILAGAGTFYLLGQSRPSAIRNSVNSGTAATSINIFTNSGKDPDDRYQGQALNFLGSQESLAKYPKLYVERQKSFLAQEVVIITKSPKDVDAWIEVGILKKSAGNFSGARDAFEYARKIAPGNPVVYHDLGDLYGSYLRDYPKAEFYYQRAIALDPASDFHYLALAEFYRDFYKDKYNQTAGVLLKGLAVLPDNANLLLDLGFYYKSIRDKESAVNYFEKFLKTPDVTGAQQQAIQQEIDKLKNS